MQIIFRQNIGNGVTQSFRACKMAASCVCCIALPYFWVMLFWVNRMIEGYTTVKKISEKWGLKERTVQIMCADGKINGAVKFGRDWAIPVDAVRPEDGRIVSGKYVDWRKIQQ